MQRESLGAKSLGLGSLGLVVALGLLVGSVAPAAHAASTTISFVWGLPDGGASPLGPHTILEGSLTFRTDAVDSNPQAVAGSYDGIVTSLEFSLTDLDTGASSPFGFAPGPSIQNSMFVLNGYFDSATGNTVDLVRVRAPVSSNALGVLALEIWLESFSDVLPSDGVPTADQLNRLGTDRAMASFYYSEVILDFQPIEYFAVTVPEPGSLLTLFGVTSALGLGRRWRPSRDSNAGPSAPEADALSS